MNAQLKSQQNWVVTASLSVLAVCTISIALYFTRDILIPFVVAIFIGSLVSPLMDVMELKWKWKHSVSVLVALAVVVVATCLFGAILMGSITTVVDRSKEYANSFSKLADNVDDWVKLLNPVAEDEDADETAGEPDESETTVVGNANEPAGSTNIVGGDSPSAQGVAAAAEPAQNTRQGVWFPLNDDGTLGEGKVVSTPLTKAEAEESSITDVSPDEDTSLMRTYLLGLVPELATWIAGSSVTLFSGATLTLIFVMFVLAGRDPKVVRQGVYAEIDTQVRSYISTKVALSLGTGVLVWLVFWSIGVFWERPMPMAPVFGVIAFLLNFIPSVGSIISTMVPIPFALAMVPELFERSTTGAPSPIGADAITFLVAIVCLPGSVQMLIGNVLEPKLMGNDLHLHPITILLALALWGLLWGPIGMLLAVPMTAIIRIVLMKFEITQIAGKALAGELPDLDAAEKQAAGKAQTAPDLQA